MSRLIKFDMNRILVSVGFPAAVLVTFLLCFTEDIYIDSFTMQAYSVFEVLFRFERTFMERDFSFSSFMVFQNALSGYSAMFLPIVASFPFVYLQSAERNSGNIRFAIFRTKGRKYYLSKFICAVVSGGLCVMLGVMLFGIFSLLAFPHVEHYPAFSVEPYVPDGVLTEVVRKLVSSFIYGCVNTVFAFFLSSFCRNRYIVLCVPFLMRFIQDTATKKIMVYEGGEEIYQRVFPFTCSAPAQIPYLDSGPMLYSTIGVMVIFMVLMLFGYIMIMTCRTDKGE